MKNPQPILTLQCFVTSVSSLTHLVPCLLQTIVYIANTLSAYYAAFISNYRAQITQSCSLNFLAVKLSHHPQTDLAFSECFAFIGGSGYMRKVSFQY